MGIELMCVMNLSTVLMKKRIISRYLYNISDLRIGELLKDLMPVPDSVSEVYSWSPGCGFSTADGKEVGGFWVFAQSGQ